MTGDCAEDQRTLGRPATKLTAMQRISGLSSIIGESFDVDLARRCEWFRHPERRVDRDPPSMRSLPSAPRGAAASHTKRNGTDAISGSIDHIS